MKIQNVALFKAPTEQREDEYISVLEGAGYTVHLVPVIQFQYINQQELRSALEAGDEYTGIIFSSTRAVESVYRVQPRPEVFENKDIYVVGKGTREIVQDRLGLTGLGEETGSAEKLAQYIIQHKQNRKMSLLYPCSTLAKHTLTAALEEGGVPCRRLESYETTESRDLQTAVAGLGPVQAAVFFSPSGVHSALPYLRQRDQLTFVAIGETTRSALREHVSEVHCAEKPTPAAVLDVINSLSNRCS